MPPMAELALRAFDDALAVLAPGEPGAKVRWCSESFAQLLQGTPADWQGQPLAVLMARLPGLDEGLDALADAAPAWSGPVNLHGADAKPRWALASLRATAGADGQGGAGEPAWALRLQAEAEQERATRRHLEDRERLLFTSRSVAVGEMATTLAHELNQPLGAVTNVLRGLKTRLAGAVANPSPSALQALEQGVQLALDQVQYASRIIGRMRDYTQSRQPRRERVDLHALLHNSLTLLDWDLRRHGVQLNLGESLRALPAPAGQRATHVVGDGVMLQQVLVNLLRNAIDAMAGTPAGQRVLDIGARTDEGGQIEIAIADTGSGIGQDAAQQLFTPFFSTKPTGMGIGLNICRSLIELHQGRLWFSPNPERGCTFYLALPLADAQADGLPRFLVSEETPA
ncbi:MAG: sensor histidine kinase [Pseudomonadota bacterium]|nr:sensor histidine kinase [Pseudomonadota bacterium]